MAENSPIAYLFQRVTQIENEMLKKDRQIKKIESDLLLSNCRVKKLEENIKHIENGTLDIKMNTEKQNVFSFNIKKENCSVKNEEEYGEEMAQYMKTEGGMFPLPKKQVLEKDEKLKSTISVVRVSESPRDLKTKNLIKDCQ